MREGKKDAAEAIKGKTAELKEQTQRSQKADARIGGIHCMISFAPFPTPHTRMSLPEKVRKTMSKQLV